MPSKAPMNATRTTAWLISAAFSLSTTKYLLDRRMHYPMHLLVLQLSSAATFRVLQWLMERFLGQTKGEDAASVSPPQQPRALWSLLYAICLSVALVCAYEAVHHTVNVPVAVIACSLASLGSWPYRGDATPATSKRIDFSMATMIRIFVGLSGAIIVLFSDYRLSAISIIMTLASATLLHLAAKFLPMTYSATKQPEVERWPCQVITLEPTMLGIVGGLVAAGFWCHFREQNFWRDMGASNPMAYNDGILAMNLICSGLSYGIGHNVFTMWYRPSSSENASAPPSRTSPLVLSVTLVSLVSVGSLVFPTMVPYSLSVWQWLGYAAIVAVMLPTEDHHDTKETPAASDSRAVPATPKTEEGVSETEGLLAKAQEEIAATTSYPPLGPALMILLAMIMLSLPIRSHPRSPQVVLDNTMQPSKTLDVVIARYEEPASKVAAQIAKLLAQPRVGGLGPTFWIYNKNGATTDSMHFLNELNTLFDSTQVHPQVLVHTLPNIGREADTFLAHITTQWDNLANHTMFMQATPHAEYKMLQLVTDYFVPRTGFLSLSYTHTANNGYCKSCDDCYDRDWTENPTLLHDLYSDFNHGSRCADMLLTYRGQFIASAARIRGNKRETYTKWLDELRKPDGRLHTPPYTTSKLSRKPDSLNAPRAGFTFERMWATMMQCSGRRIAERCPSWLSSVVSPTARVEPRDCQCLD